MRAIPKQVRKLASLKPTETAYLLSLYNSTCTVCVHVHMCLYIVSYICVSMYVRMNSETSVIRHSL